MNLFVDEGAPMKVILPVAVAVFEIWMLLDPRNVVTVVWSGIPGPVIVSLAKITDVLGRMAVIWLLPRTVLPVIV